MGIKQDMIAFVGELIGTTMFLFLGLGGVQTAQNSVSESQLQTASTVTLNNQTILFISTSMGLSLLVNAWIFYRITGGLFNPAVTLALWMIGAVPSRRAVLLTIAQIVGGIFGAGLVQLLTPYTVSITSTTLAEGMNIGQGLMMEAFLTAMLVFAVLMLAAEKHKATFIAPIGIGLVLFVCQLLGTLWTGCGMNPARSFGPSVVARSFVHYHWIYWLGPFIGSLIAVAFYMLLKAFDYGSVVLGQDSDTISDVAPVPVYQRVLSRFHLSNAVKEQKEANAQFAASQAEKGMNGHAHTGQSNRDRANRNSAATLVEEQRSPVKAKKPKEIVTDARGQDHGAIASPNTHKGANLGAVRSSAR